MTRPPGVGLTDFDPTDPDFFIRPDYFDVLATLRAEAPIHRVAEGLVTIARYDDIREISRDPARFRSSGGALINDPMRTGGPGAGGAPSLLFLDPPEHARDRGLVSRKFTPRAVSAVETRVRALTRAVFDRLPDTSEPIDVVGHLTAPFPLLVIAELLGIPDGDRANFRRRSDAAIESTDRPAEETMASIMEMHAFLAAHLEAKQRDPGDDIVSLLGQVEVDGRRLASDEVFIWLLTLLVAGNETTRTLLTVGMVALADPDQRAALAADPTGISAAVEECLRWVTPIQAFCRTVVADTTVGDVAVRANDYLVMLYASGNRDEAAFGPTAGAFDITRSGTAPNLAFGFGEHLCLGAALARLEARIFFEELLARFPTFRLAGAPERVPSTLVAGIHRLPVALKG